MRSVLQMLQAVDLLKRGERRLTVLACHCCGRRNRVDRWRIIFGRALFANCGCCHTRLMARTVKK